MFFFIYVFHNFFNIRIQELMAVPWARVKDYLYLLSALQTQTSKDHADQANVDYVFHTLRDVQVYVKQVNR